MRAGDFGSRGARMERAKAIEDMVARVAAGEDLLLLCHCRRVGETRQVNARYSNRCHGDDIASTVTEEAKARASPPPLLTPQRLPCEQVDELVKEAAVMIKCENESGKLDEVR